MKLFKRKKPWVDLQHEEDFIPANYSERGVKTGAKLDEYLVGNEDLKRIFSASNRYESPAEFIKWLDDNINTFDSSTYIVNTDDGNALDTLRGHHPRLIVNMMGLTRIRHLNTFLNKANEAMVDGGYLVCHSRTSGLKKKIILKAHPGALGKMMYFFHYVWHRVLARMKWTRWFYMWVTKGKNRSYSRVELLGRMYRAGFEVVDERFHRGEFYLLGQKFRKPIWDDDPTFGALVKLNIGSVIRGK